MTDDNTPDTPDVPTPDDVTDPDKQPDALPEKPVEHEPPPWVETIVQAIESIPDKIAASVPNPVAPEEIPGIEDEGPSKPPWTHRGF